VQGIVTKHWTGWWNIAKR